MIDTNDEQAHSNLLRAISDMRGEVKDMRNEMHARFDKAAKEHWAIRDVVDSLRIFQQIAALEAQTSAIVPRKKQIHRIQSDVDKVISRLDRVHIPPKK